MADVSRERFLRWFGELAAIGHTDTGWNRVAWTPLEAEARSWFTRTAEAIGLHVLKDGAGSLWAVTSDADGGPWVCTGSHLDTQPQGGAYDGALGMVSSLEAAASLLESGLPRRHPLAVAAFVDEEGARFRTPTFASLAITGGLDIDHVLEVMDGAEGIYGVTRDSLVRSARQLARVRCFLEVHVEQGRALASRGLALGIADVLAPRQRWRVEFAGEANHAGTTSMADRRDALLPAARFILAVDEVARAHPGSVGTVGRVEVEPGSTNSIPGRVALSLDVRGLVARSPGRPLGRVEKRRCDIRHRPAWCAGRGSGCARRAGRRPSLLRRTRCGHPGTSRAGGHALRAQSDRRQPHAGRVGLR
jgi:beta-ureidopropionase / N-carbamoyl-L-amino-acid hydrolase